MTQVDEALTKARRLVAASKSMVNAPATDEPGMRIVGFKVSLDDFCDPLNYPIDCLRSLADLARKARATPSPSQTDGVKQADRDAAAAQMPLNTIAECERVADVKAGFYDKHPLVLAFAKHRIQALGGSHD